MINILIGITLMSLIATIGFTIAENKGDENIIVFFLGPAFLILWIIVVILRYILKFIRYYNLRSLLVCPDGKIRYCKPQHADKFRLSETEEYDFPAFKDLSVSVDLWKEEYRNFEIANMRYCPKEVWKAYEPISKKNNKEG